MSTSTTYLFPSLVTALAILVYLVLSINVGAARAKYKIMPPAMGGNANFERVLRVQQNTLEQSVVFFPSLWLFAFYVSPLWAGILGLIWVLGRIIYAIGYYQAAEKRILGFALGSLSGMGLLLGSLGVIAWQLYQQYF